MSTIEARLAELGLELPPAPAPGAVYQPAVITGNLIYLSGHVSMKPDGTFIQGKVGRDLSLEEGQAAARQVALLMLSTLKATLGSLDRMQQLVKTLGMVNSEPEFDQHHLVINGYSELMREVYGPGRGVGARSAVGMILPHAVAVEIEAIFEISPA
ncbi:MAG: RidA family protein [Bacteroidota bacterium]